MQPEASVVPLACPLNSTCAIQLAALPQSPRLPASPHPHLRLLKMAGRKPRSLMPCSWKLSLHISACAQERQGKERCSKRV